MKMNNSFTQDSNQGPINRIMDLVSFQRTTWLVDQVTNKISNNEPFTLKLNDLCTVAAQGLKRLIE